VRHSEQALLPGKGPEIVEGLSERNDMRRKRSAQAQHSVDPAALLAPLTTCRQPYSCRAERCCLSTPAATTSAA